MNTIDNGIKSVIKTQNIFVNGTHDCTKVVFVDWYGQERVKYFPANTNLNTVQWKE